MHAFLQMTELIIKIAIAPRRFTAANEIIQSNFWLGKLLKYIKAPQREKEREKERKTNTSTKPRARSNTIQLACDTRSYESRLNSHRLSSRRSTPWVIMKEGRKKMQGSVRGASKRTGEGRKSVVEVSALAKRRIRKREKSGASHTTTATAEVRKRVVLPSALSRRGRRPPLSPSLSLSPRNPVTFLLLSLGLLFFLSGVWARARFLLLNFSDSFPNSLGCMWNLGYIVITWISKCWLMNPLQWNLCIWIRVLLSACLFHGNCRLINKYKFLKYN